MKKRIANFGISATHQLIFTLSDFNQEVSVSEFDALALDPAFLVNGIHPQNYQRRIKEIRDLVGQKGGIVVCLIRPETSIVLTNATSGGSIYSLFGQVGPHIQTHLQTGSGSTIKPIANAKGVSGGYLRVLQGALRFTAYLDASAETIKLRGGEVFAVDSVSHPVAVEFPVQAGRICFVPVPDGADGNRVGSAIVRVIEAHYGGPGEIEEPVWLKEVTVPGANIHDSKIVQLEEFVKQIEEEIKQLKQKRAGILNYRILLYGFGKSVLEPVVRAGLRELGFVVPEPDQYTGEWDAELNLDRLSTFAIAEIEGSEGIIDVDKYRQLLSYIQDEALEGRDHKGILVGNGFRLTAPEAPERQAQFSQHTLRGADKNQFCLLPTTELFKSVCAVLEAPSDEGLKIKIQDSILSTVGVWSFARPISSPSDAPNAAESAGGRRATS